MARTHKDVEYMVSYAGGDVSRPRIRRLPGGSMLDLADEFCRL
jgi:hypothetical protein